MHYIVVVDGDVGGSGPVSAALGEVGCPDTAAGVVRFVAFGGMAAV
jgi:hypothetical protein